jgi:hypothetical protein
MMRDIHDHRSITSSIHLINCIDIGWKFKKQAVTTLYSTGSEITSLTSGVKKTNHLRDFLASLGYPVGASTPIFEGNQGTIKAIRATRIHGNARHPGTKLYSSQTAIQHIYVASLFKPRWHTLLESDLPPSPIPIITNTSNWIVVRY